MLSKSAGRNSLNRASNRSSVFKIEGVTIKGGQPMKFFNYDSPIMQFLSRITDLFILNFLFLICSIPIVTIGAAATALYSVTLKMAKNEESYIFSSFFRAFKSNFKHSTVSWLILLLAGIVLAMDYRAVGIMGGSFQQIFSFLLFFLCIIFLFPAIYIFPYIARFENTIKNSLKNAFIISIAQLPYTVLLLLLLAAAVAFTMFIDFRIVGFVWFVIGFSGLAYLGSFLYRRAFQKFE